MKTILTNNKILYVLGGVLLLLLIGMTNIQRYDYYKVPAVDIEYLDNTEEYINLGTQVILDEDCLCEVVIDYYKNKQEFHDHLDLYIVVITISIDQDEDVSTEVVSEYDSISKVSVRADLSMHENYTLENYMTTDWSSEVNGWDMSISLQHLFGTIDLRNSSNQVGYMHSGTSSVGNLYNGVFTYREYINDSTIQTYYMLSIPEEETPQLSFEYKIEMKHTTPLLFSLNRHTIVGEWKEVTVTYTNE